jgi:hypothetical protein
MVGSGFPIPGYREATELTTYGLKDGCVQPIAASELIIKDGNAQFTSGSFFIALIIPLLLVLHALLSTTNDRRGRKQTWLFSGFMLIVLFTSSISGWYIGPILGGIVGFILGVMGLLAGMATSGEKWSGSDVFGTMLSAILSSILVGFLSGFVGKAHSQLVSTDMAAIWQYIFIYTATCLVAILGKALWRGPTSLRHRKAPQVAVGGEDAK